MMIRFTTIFLFIMVFTLGNLKAQIPGCTDPLANNFNASATQNDGSCSYNFYTLTPVSSFQLNTSIPETSGLIQWNGSIWTHNDNTDLNIYSLDTLNGSILQPFLMGGVSNTDWEEIAQDSGFIYLGDFGNNANGNRTNLKILRVDKNSVISGSPVIDTIAFSYSDQIDFTPAGADNTEFDCEAMVVMPDSIFLFTKKWISNETSVYSLSKYPGVHVAQLREDFDVDGLITGATCLQQQRTIILSGYTSLLQPFLWLLYDFNGYDFFSGNKRRVELGLPFHQIEGVSTLNGRKLYLSSEAFSFPPVINNPPELHVAYLDSLLGGYLDSLTGTAEILEGSVYLNIYPVPSSGNLIIETDFAPADFIILDISGQIVSSGKLFANRNELDVSHFMSGSYMVRIKGGNGMVFNKTLILD